MFCTICAVPLDLKREREDPEVQPVEPPPPPKRDRMKEELAVYFFLTRLFKYQVLQSSQLTQLFQKELLSEAFRFCEACFQEVSKSQSLQLEIAALEAKQEEIKGRMEELILSRDCPSYYGELLRQRVKEETSVIEIQPDEFEDEVGNSYESDTQYVDEGQQFDSDDDEEEEEFVVENWETSETERRAQRQASKGKQKAKLLPCPMCPQKFAKSSVLSRHIHKRHRKEFVCKVCGMTFGRKDYFMVHVKCHVGYQVEDDDDSPADRKRTSNTTVDYHMEPESPDPFDDMFEDPSYNNNKRSSRRSQKGVRKSGKNLCVLCSVVFGEFSSMMRHIMKEHKDTMRKMKVCEVCGMHVLTDQFMEEHKAREHKEKETDDEYDREDMDDELSVSKRIENLTCNPCSRLFDKPSSLNTHHRQFHADPDRAICQVCGKSVKSEALLKLHMVVHDEGAKPFKCPTCGKECRRKKDLVIHMRVHSEDKKLLCSLCGDVFRHEYSLRRHNQLKHEGGDGRDHTCTICGKSFKIRWLLRQHMMSKSHGGKGLKKRPRSKKEDKNDSSSAAHGDGDSDNDKEDAVANKEEAVDESAHGSSRNTSNTTARNAVQIVTSIPAVTAYWNPGHGLNFY